MNKGFPPTALNARTGELTPPTRADFVAVVAVLRDASGAFIGTAFGFLDAVDAEGRSFEATGFPVGDVASVEVFSTG